VQLFQRIETLQLADPEQDENRWATGAVKAVITIVAGPDSSTASYGFLPKFYIAALLVLISIASGGADASRPEQGDDRPPEREATKRAWQIECVGPDTNEAVPLSLKDARIRCTLRYGITSFIIRLADPGQGRYVTLENENMAVRGRLLIAVSNELLPVNNPKWSAVGGAIPFRHKRLFDLSLIGVEAKFVKLTFQVDGPGKITGRGEPDQPADRFTVQP